MWVLSRSDSADSVFCIKTSQDSSNTGITEKYVAAAICDTQSNTLLAN